MVGRAIREGWNVDKEFLKEALIDVINLKDPELMLEATKLLILADGLDVKREELALKRETKENELKLKLLAIAGSVPIAELAALASGNGIAVKPAGEIGTREATFADGEETRDSA
jgi:hypothetical protein